MLEADTLTGDLYFYENAEVRIVWPATQQFRGVSEGNVTRYALARDEPLRVEHEAFLDLIAGRRDSGVVTLESGVEIVRVAEAVLESARTGETVAAVSRAQRALMRAVVVALGKIGLPIAAKIALAGHEVVGCDIDPRVVELVGGGEGAVPRRGGTRRGARRDRPRRAPAREHRHDRRGRRGARPRDRRAAARRRLRRPPGLRRARLGARRHRAGPASPGPS